MDEENKQFQGLARCACSKHGCIEYKRNHLYVLAHVLYVLIPDAEGSHEILYCLRGTATNFQGCHESMILQCNQRMDGFNLDYRMAVS